jgi:hypothetical protein
VVSGPTAKVRELVWKRAGSRCERCCAPITGGDHSIHHRRPRRMGGSKDPLTNSPANLLLLCGSGTTGCHGWIESHRATAYELGLLVHGWQDPRAVPLLGGVYLTDHGTYTCAPQTS